MTDKIITRRLDDLHAQEGREVEADRRYTFGFEGDNYQLDLGTENAAEFELVFTRYLKAATKLEPKDEPKSNGKRVQVRTSSDSTNRRKTSKETAKAIRDWAAEEGIVMNERGPIPLELKELFAAATGKS
jgi:hypothetical protein